VAPDFVVSSLAVFIGKTGFAENQDLHIGRSEAGPIAGVDRPPASTAADVLGDVNDSPLESIRCG
jgi:hypothetical protein